MNKFNFLTFLEVAGHDKRNKTLWRMRCDCGKTTIVSATQVRSGKTKSCGHLKHVSRPKHGKRNSKVYIAWCNMKARCDNQLHPQFKDYGGRGIKYDPSWVVFENFYRDVGDPKHNTDTLDRINNNAGYEVKNVRWATRAVQSRNTRSNILVEIEGKTKCLYDWCDEYKISAGSVYRRLAKGMDIVSAITLPKAVRYLTLPES